ncbi:hypothetical protein SAMN05519104_4380 [Rhizobiales bacterium GAS188]|nr:hypothetical protein SAMN05519104_4380 [Rhizobiales bacterium GAS188]
MNWNLPQHTYEEIREVVAEVMSNAPSNGVNQFMNLLEVTARTLSQRRGAPPLPTGIAYPGAASQLHLNDETLVLEVVWDLFRQGIITLGLNSSNPGWPWLRLSRFGQQAIQNQSPYRFHDTNGFLKILRAEVPDISVEAILYLEEAIGAFYADCLLASCVMLGVAAESEFLRLIEVATKSLTHGATFSPVNKVAFIRQKITKFHELLKPIIKTLPHAATEDLEINLNAIQSIIRIARNDSGHPTGAKPPMREQVYVSLQLFIPYARQLMRLRNELA